MIDFSPSLAHLLQPLSLQTFVSRYHEREMLVIHRDNPSHYDGLLGATVLQDIIDNSALTSDEILVVDDARGVEVDAYVRSDGRVDALRVLRLFSEGATITLRQMQRRLPAIAKLCRSAELQLSCPFQANLYFSPPDAQGLATHHDTHDVFILQLQGSKQWQTYEPSLPLPLPGQRYYWPQPPSAGARPRFELGAGDLLYCPRGTPHHARANDRPSVHLSLGALVSTWAEYLLEVVADVALRDPALRGGLPPGYATVGIAPELLQRTLKQLLDRVSSQARPQQVIDAMADRFINEGPLLMSGQLETLRATASLSLDSRVGGRPGVLYRLQEQGGKSILIGNARRITFPRRAAPALQFALSQPAFVVKELPGALTDSGKLTLIKRLMREGFAVAISDLP